jgi:hypothetical protein
MLNVIMINVIILSVIMLIVVAPCICPWQVISALPYILDQAGDYPEALQDPFNPTKEPTMLPVACTINILQSSIDH